ncbi:Nucleoside-diphosphate-sugar epimerase [Enhydrobacter aerosaccus]|uniref:Nucleoside-diphosphate-sugar epimerase n=1 Tax=Enhydrobacter aerosaccus TaxID=225324 RepID=A0A1T4NRF4_9HYPH|nr:SDR family oxidoreductase [Enhydrobacter aerosaccus]SJZ81833.1 Nucleoside-diphosphate-sugar epimerase [Enhydrobacter aerosaccus]
MTGRLFVFGLGFAGLEIAKLALAKGWSITGTCTTPEKAARLRARGIEAVVFDGTAAAPAEAFAGATHILCTIAPGTTGDPALRLCRDSFRDARWLGYLSTTGVYGDRGGDWVDEATPPAPTQRRSIDRLATEEAWQALGTKLGAATDIFRLPGIYGPGRSAIDQVLSGTARRIDKPGQVFSRIHVADIATAVLAAMSRGGPGAIYNLADDLPASSAEVTAFACELLGVPRPPLLPWEQVAPTMSAMARSFYAENRRVRNDRMKRELGVALRYPTFREGLQAIAAELPARP